MVFASSAAVYGAGHSEPIVESAARAPSSPYGVHKAMLEMAAESWARHFGVRVAIIRLFSVYGPQLRKQLIWELAGKILAGQRSLLLGGTGLETRDWVHIGDAARILIDAIRLADASVPLFNASGGEAKTVRDTIALLTTVANAKVDIQFSGEVRPGDPTHLIGDPAQANRAGLTARVPLEDGLRETLRWIEYERTRAAF
jgi:UDP-glucose 4-epimerase